MKLAALVLLSVCCLLADLHAPVAGVIRDRHGNLRQILGASGAFVAGESLATGIVSASFSGKLGLAKTEDELIIFDATHVIERRACPEGPALFRFDEQGRPASVHFLSTDEHWRWLADGKVSVSFEKSAPHASESFEERMSAEWMVVHTSDADLAVRGEESLQLPEVSEQ